MNLYLVIFIIALVLCLIILLYFYAFRFEPANFTLSNLNIFLKDKSKGKKENKPKKGNRENLKFNYKIKRNPLFTVLHLSDFHLRRDKKGQKLFKFVKSLSSINPDFLFITGDLVEKDENVDYLISMLSSFEAKYGKYVVFGVHDYYNKTPVEFIKNMFKKKREYARENNIPSLISRLKNIGITTLRNESISVPIEKGNINYVDYTTSNSSPDANVTANTNASNKSSINNNKNMNNNDTSNNNVRENSDENKKLNNPKNNIIEVEVVGLDDPIIGNIDIERAFNSNNTKFGNINTKEEFLSESKNNDKKFSSYINFINLEGKCKDYKSINDSSIDELSEKEKYLIYSKRHRELFKPKKENVHTLNNKSKIRIALLHTPDSMAIAELSERGVDIILSGHTHGGQVRIPGIGAIISGCRIKTKFASGLFYFKNLVLYVSRGLGEGRYSPFRFFCQPEATLINLFLD